MSTPINAYWAMRLERVKKSLEKNNFKVFIAGSGEEAKTLAMSTILSSTGAKVVSFGGSATVMDTGLHAALKNAPGLSVIDTVDYTIPRDEFLERRRQALLCDLFCMSANAVTETGQLVNLDATGNRVAALAYGPKNVLVLAGRNKIVPTLNAAMDRIREYAAPTNAIRLNRKTPCAKTSHCEDCASPDRICNVWTITEKSSPGGRIIVVLINEDLGL